MDPGTCRAVEPSEGLPRMRGDGPWPFDAQMFDAEATPRTRGWTRLVRVAGLAQHGYPAHAEMDRRPLSDGFTPTRLPRARGDGPYGDGRKRGALRGEFERDPPWVSSRRVGVRSPEGDWKKTGRAHGRARPRDAFAATDRVASTVNGDAIGCRTPGFFNR